MKVGDSSTLLYMFQPKRTKETRGFGVMPLLVDDIIIIKIIIIII